MHQRLRFRVDNYDGTSSTDLAVHNYLAYKSNQPYYTSWLSSTAILDKVITAYDEHRLHIVRGDFASTDDNSAIAKIVSYTKVAGKHISVVYLSNIENATYISNKGDLENNLHKLANDDTLIISTHSTTTSRSIALPALVEDDPSLKRLSLPWNYCVQTFEDRKEEKPGLYPSIHDRVDAVTYQGVNPSQVGIIMPKSGIVLAGLSL